METESAAFRGGFWLPWVAADTVGGLVGNYIATNVASSWMMAGTLFGAGMGMLQWPVCGTGSLELDGGYCPQQPAGALDWR